MLQTLQNWLKRFNAEGQSPRRRLEPDERQALLAELQGERPAARWQAASALAQSDPGYEGVAALAALLNNPDPLLRSEAALSLGRIGTEAALQALLKAASSNNPVTQASAADGFGVMPTSADTVEALLSLLLNRDADVRQSAAEALGRMTPLTAAQASSLAIPSVQPTLLKLLGSDQSLMVRRAAALALGKWGDAASQSVLAAQQANPREDWRVREAAAAALRRMTGGAAEDADA